MQGLLNSTPEATFVLRFFANPAAQPDEGKRFLGQKSVTTLGDGKVSFAFAPTQAVAVGQTITATATDSQGNTSEFSAAKIVTTE